MRSTNPLESFPNKPVKINAEKLDILSDMRKVAQRYCYTG